MLVSEAKKNFLEKVIGLSNVNIVEFAREILPYKLQGYDAYTLITAMNVNKSDEFIKRADILSFYKTVYDTWFDFVTGLDENKKAGKTRETIIKIKTDKRFNKNNMSSLDCEKFFLETFDNEFSESDELRPASIQNKTIVDVDDADFVHVYPFTRVRMIDCRLYVNLKPKNSIKLGNILMEKCCEKHYKLYFKFWTGNDRNDSFLIYTNYGRVQDMVDMLNGIKAEHPEIFDGAEKTSELLPLIDGYIGFGEEPVYKQRSSYNVERGKALDEFFTDSIKKQWKEMGNYNGLITNSLGQQLNLKDYLVYLLERSFKETIRTRQIEILNRQYSDEYKTAQQIRDYIEIQKNIYEKCKDRTPDFLKQQIEEKAEEIIKSLKSGGCPTYCYLTFKTQKISLLNYSEYYARELLKKNWGVDYFFKLDLNPRQKLFDVFGVQKKISQEITEEALKPYFENHHVSIKNPFLNTETQHELDQESKNTKAYK